MYLRLGHTPSAFRSPHRKKNGWRADDTELYVSAKDWATGVAGAAGFARACG
jgi:hypothetical protein